MIVTDRDMLVLLALARYYLLDRRHVQQLVFPHDKDGRVARRRLATLTEAGLIRRHSMLVASSYDGTPAPVYLLTAKGCEYLAGATGDASFLHKPVHLPHPLHLRHHMAVTELHMLLNAVIATQTGVSLDVWHNEADVINADDPDPTNHFRIRTKFAGEPDIICSPDAGFVLSHDGQRSAFYLEYERSDGHSGTGSRQLAERKCPGYAELARQKIYLKHFPAGIDGFHVLLIVPNDQRRDCIRQAFQKKDAAAYHTDLWRFAALSDITADSLLTREISYRCGPELPERLAAVPEGVRLGASGPEGEDTLERWKIEADEDADARLTVTVTIIMLQAPITARPDMTPDRLLHNEICCR